ncbi:diguanylate cyclase [Colwellia sp. BRX8-4]|uniref:diguanylate cyclase n=1 Tax=unclassified Colwellia TaxID=196834 RepID=UPI0015F65443|nr:MULTISPECIES: diguanylate cyclase [unclassified Colwellia]MBA6353704.1 diguanylate cyclase [Colwellia sp. BRX9-1]MBA6372763.1 diguanylate cyclase [Colwellia sp. BRX8-4]
MKHGVLTGYKNILNFIYRYQNYIRILKYVITKYTACFALLIFSLTAISISAQPYVKLDNLNKIKLNEHNLWYQTQSIGINPTFAELSQLYQDAKQVTSTLGGRGAYITKIKLINTKGHEDTWFVKLHTNYLDLGTAYWQRDSGEVITLANFGQIGGTNPKLAHSQAFSLSLNQQETGTLWIYIEAKMFATPVTVKFYNKAAFYNKQFFVNSITSISFAVMLTLALIAFFIYLRTKYLVTLACTGYIGIQGLGWFLASGSFGHLFAVSTFNPVYIAIWIFPFAIASACQFTKLLFNCQQDHPKLAKTFNLLSIVCLSLGLFMPFSSFAQSYLISHVIATLWIPLCIGTGIFMLAQKDFRAKYYLIGNLLYGLTLMGYVLSHLYKIDWDISLELIVQIALTIDCICILLSLAEWLQIQQKEFHRTYAISRIDPLTQIGNRFAQNEKLASLKGHYCITFIDLDGFKKINDKLGHDEGDKVLIATADIMQKKLQGLGSIFRCGGDEFIWVVSIKSSQQVKPLLLKLSDLLIETAKELQEKGWKDAGLSFGIATSFETLNQSECLSLADKRMYKYKQDKQ